MSKSFTSVYKKCKPSLVSIYSSEASGSGFVCSVGKRKVIVTAGHVTTMTPFLESKGFSWGSSSGVLQVPQGSGTLLFRYIPCSQSGYVTLKGLNQYKWNGEGWEETDNSVRSTGGKVTLEVEVQDSVSFSFSHSTGTLTCEWSHLVGIVNGQKQRLLLIGRDGKGDVAVLECENIEKLPALKIANKTPEIGEDVAVLGNPLGLDPESIATGVVRDNAFSFPVPITIEALTTSTASYSGNSGSPIVNLNSEVVGLLCWSVGTTLINGGPTTELLRTIVEQLGQTKKSFLGLDLQKTDPWEDVQGYKLVGTSIVIVKLNGVSMRDHSPSWVTWKLPPGSRLVIDYVQDGKQRQTVIAKTLAFPEELDTAEDGETLLIEEKPVIRKGTKKIVHSVRM